MTRDTGHFTRSTRGSRSLERGLQLLRAFRTTFALTNAELADHTGLPRPTVSRLTRSLVEQGFLSYELSSGAYRLTPVFLSLALMYRTGATAADLAMPLMRKVGEKARVNVGLSVRDQLDMVYLETLRNTRSGLPHMASRGSRLPIEMTSVGLAHLAALSKVDRDAVFAQVAPRHGTAWPKRRALILKTLADAQERGFCIAEWQPKMVAVAATLPGPDHLTYSVNLSCSGVGRDKEALVATLAPLLMQLVADIGDAWGREAADVGR